MPRQPIKQERAHETRARIIAGSASSFAENGYTGSTVSDILKRSGVTKGALYFHFETKEEVAQAVLEAHAVWLEGAADRVRGQGLQGLVDLTYLFCDALVSDDVLRAAARLSVDREMFGLSQEPAFVQWERLCLEALGEVRTGAVLASGVDVDVVARVAMTMLLGSHLASLNAGSGRVGLHAEMQRFWQIALGGIARSEAVATIDISPPRKRLQASVNATQVPVTS